MSKGGSFKNAISGICREELADRLGKAAKQKPLSEVIIEERGEW